MQLFQSKDRENNDVMKYSQRKIFFCAAKKVGPRTNSLCNNGSPFLGPATQIDLFSSRLTNFLRSLRWLTFALVTAVTWEKRLQIVDQHG